MSKTFKRVIFGASVALIALVFAGSLLSRNVSADAENEGVYRQMGLYEEVLHKIQSDYVTEPNISNVTDGALHGLLDSLDPDSSYLTPAEYTDYKAHHNDGTAQVGITLSRRSGFLMVVSVVPGSPADKEQISDGDLIEAIDGKSSSSAAMARELLAGKPGTDVTFSVVRPGKSEPQKVTLTRTVVAIPALSEQQYENSSILYLKPSALTPERVSAIESRLKSMEKSGNKKVLLDLRDVVDGDPAQGVKLANAFLKTGTIATLQGQKYPKQVFSADSSHFITDAPLVVLINHGTSGAAEITAAAILGNKRGDVVGDRSFGEGVVQKTIEMPDGAAIFLSIAKYAGPDGKPIQDEAVNPNVVVSESIDQFLASEDTEGAKEQEKAAPHPDDQLNKALDVLKQKSA